MAETVTNERGGMQSKTLGRAALIPAEALLRLSEVVRHGAEEYAENNWRLIPCKDHISHALEHLFLLMNGDREDDHLGHALCRLAMATATEEDIDFKEIHAGGVRG